jgi:two-component system chemotaxis response regulator CheY
VRKPLNSLRGTIHPYKEKRLANFSAHSAALNFPRAFLLSAMRGQMGRDTLLGRPVLVVDDVRAMRAIIRSLLLNMGATQIIEAGDGCEALDKLKTGRVGLVVTDLNMSPMSGIALTQKLRMPGSEFLTPAPVLMVSGHREARLVQAAIEAGANEFMVKPFAPGDFEARVCSIFSNPRPIVSSGNYRGPDRRRRAMPVRKDRRQASA